MRGSLAPARFRGTSRIEENGFTTALARGMPATQQLQQENRERASRSRRGRRPHRVQPASFSFALARCSQLSILFSRLMLWSYGRFHRPLKSGGPTLFRPSLKVQRDGAHYLPPILLLGVLNARRSIRVRARKTDPAYLAGIGRPFGGLLHLSRSANDARYREIFDVNEVRVASASAIASLRGLEGSISKLGRRTTRSQPPGSGARAALLARRGGAVPTSDFLSAPI